MNKYRGYNNRLCYTLTTKHGKFEVRKGENRIIKHEPYYRTDAMIIYGNTFFWETVPPFESFIQAVKFLKENADKLR